MNGKFVSIGIDLGMTYSSMAFVGVTIDGSGMPLPKPEIATDQTGTRIDHQFVPSQVCAYLKNDNLCWAVGAEAQKKSIEYKLDSHLFRNYKLQIGDVFLDEEFNTEQMNPHLRSLLHDVTPDFVARKVIEYLYQLAFQVESAPLYGYGIESVSVSVPALWPDKKKKSIEDLTKLALQPANVEKIQLIEEPVAALYFQIRQQAHLLSGPEKYVMVIDYGGGTCDVAVVKIEKNAEKLQADSKNVANVIGRASSENGGVLIDREIAKMLRRKLSSAVPSYDDYWYMSIAEKLKIEFSYQIRDSRGTGTNPGNLKLKYEIDMSQFGQYPKRVEMTMTSFSKLLSDILSKLEEPILNAINHANDTEERKGKSKLELQDIQHVFLAGGTALLPLVKDEVRRIFEVANNRVTVTDIQPRIAIVYGDALHAFQFDHGIGLGIGFTLQESIWLEGVFKQGIRVAKRGTILPYKYVYSVRSASWKTEKITVALYKGPSRIMSNNQGLEKGLQREDFILSKPAKLGTKFVFEVTINESGFLDFKLIRPDHPQDTFTRKGYVPYRSDIEAMSERATHKMGGNS